LLVLVIYIVKQWVYILYIYIYRIEISPNYQILVSFTNKMAAKELKALVDLGTSLGYTGKDLKQWLNEEMRIDREKEEEKKPQEEEKKRAVELEKLKIEA